MIPSLHLYAAVVVASTSLVSAHIAFWTDAMWGFNISDVNRPQDPLYNLTFDEWWFHGHLAHPPHPDSIMQLPAGGVATSQLSCDKDSTTYWPSGPGGDQISTSQPDYPCPGQPITEFHTNGLWDLGGCALAVAYKSDVSEVKPEDFAVFSVNHTCVWYMHTDFQVPADMPPCPDGKCICAWFWIHLEDSGSEQMYMNGFQCNFTNTTSTKTVGPPQVPRRCGPEASNNYTWNHWNCTNGPQQPFYWLQQEGNNMFEGYYQPPHYQELYNFLDGAQNNIFIGDYNTTNTSSSTTLPSATGTARLLSNQTSSLSPSQGTPTSYSNSRSSSWTTMPGPSNLSASAMPSSTDMSAPGDAACYESGSVYKPGPSKPASSSPTTGTVDPTDTSNPESQTASSGTISNDVPPTSSGMNMPGPSSSSTKTANHPAKSKSSGDHSHHWHWHPHHHHHHHGWHHGHGHHWERSSPGEVDGVRRAWGAQHRRSAGERQS